MSNYYENEITVSGSHKVPQGYFYEAPISIKTDPIEMLSDEEIDEKLLKEYSGIMPLSWIASESEKIKKRKLSSSIKTETKVKAFYEIKRNDNKIKIKAGIKSIDKNKDDIFRIMTFSSIWEKYIDHAIQNTIRPIIEAFEI